MQKLMVKSLEDHKSKNLKIGIKLLVFGERMK